MDLLWGFYLGWDWHPVLFLIILGLSVLLASMAGRQVLWVLPALVLYNGLDWFIPSFWGVDWMWLFRLVFVILVIVAIVTALRPGVSRAATWPIKQMAGLIALLLVIAVLTWGNGIYRDMGEPDLPYDACDTIDGEPDSLVQKEVPKNYEDDGEGNCVRKEKEEGTDPLPSEEPEVCPARFVQDPDPHERNRVVSDGFEGTPQHKRRQLIESLAVDYDSLALFGEVLFKRRIDEDALVTADGECLTKRGRKLHAQVEGALLASGVKEGMAPRVGFNTGVTDHGPVVAKRRGIFGDRRATIYTLKDGTKLIVLDRCGNIVLESKPKHMPEGPTDNPRPPKKPPPSDGGGCVEIPNNGIFDCGIKREAQEPAQQGNVPTNVTGPNPGTGGKPASQPSAQPEETYNPPDPPDSGSTRDAPTQEPSTPASASPEPSPTQDPCVANPDWC